MSAGSDRIGSDSFGNELHTRPRAVTQLALSPERLPGEALSGSQLSLLGAKARREGTIAGALTGIAGAAAVYALNAWSPRFRTSLGISGKTALWATPAFGAFFLKSHLVLAKATADKDEFIQGKQAQPLGAGTAGTQTSLSPLQSLANTVYSSPIKTLLGVAAPLYAAIFYYESTQPATKNLPFSQRLIHTRVYGQAVAVTTTILVFGFLESMRAEGAYVVYDGHVIREAQLPKDRLKHWYSDICTEGEQQSRIEHEDRDDSGNVGSLKYDLLVPLLYAPLLPMMIIGLRGRVSKDRLTQIVSGTIAVALAHAGYIMFSDSSVQMN